MSSPAEPGRWVERRRLAGALVASCCFHVLAIAFWLSLVAGLFSGVPMPGSAANRIGSSASRGQEIVFTTIEFRPKPRHTARVLSVPRTRYHAPVRVMVAIAPMVARKRVPEVKRVASLSTAARSAVRSDVASVRAETEAAGVAPEAQATPVAVATAEATEPAVTAEPSAPPKVAAETGLWGLDSDPVLLDRVGALIGEVHRRLRIEIAVDARGKATSVRVVNGGDDEGLVRRVVSVLLSAHYAAARCNNLPCSGELVLAYP